MEHDTKDIVTMQIVDKREVGLKSTNMEKEAMKRGLDYLLEAGMTVGEVVTDAHVQIASMMCEYYKLEIVI